MPKRIVSGTTSPTQTGFRPVDAGRLDCARLLERLSAFQVELVKGRVVSLPTYAVSIQ